LVDQLGCADAAGRGLEGDEVMPSFLLPNAGPSGSRTTLTPSRETDARDSAAVRADKDGPNFEPKGAVVL
jgi:hypothetical protein